ncbi:MAG: hypothetical protein KIT87_02330 [Anaerolineae bacterium]|nr:hypothetical protein [Anaerolineae bacterium]
MRAKSALDSPLAQAAALYLAGLLMYGALRRPRPAAPDAGHLPRRPVGQAPQSTPPAPAPAPRQTAPPLPPTPAHNAPLLRLEQPVRVECGGIIYEGFIQSIYIEGGAARLGLVDSLPEPLNENLWTWDDEGDSDGR